MSRSYRGVRPKSKHVYKVEEVMALYGVCRNTVSNWVHKGLRPSDDKQPQVFRGAELTRFHSAQRKPKEQLTVGEVYCVGCREPVLPDAADQGRSDGTLTPKMICPDCKNSVGLGLAATDRTNAKSTKDLNTGPDHTDKYVERVQPRIGKDRLDYCREIHFANDRLISDWFLFAGKMEPSTVEAYLTAIREFEGFCGGLAFDRIEPEDADRYRKWLIERSKVPTKEGGLRRSTLRHRAAHLKSFFEWVCNKPAFKRLDQMLPAYFELPRGALSEDLENPPKPYPTIEEALQIVSEMSADSPIQRRDRAIVAMAFVFALRSGALITLRGKHFDPDTWIVDHDGRTIRGKNKKSFRVYAFPRTEDLKAFINEWMEERARLGFKQDDALFPSANDLKFAVEQRERVGSIAPMKSASAVQKAFKAAREIAGYVLSSHAARHCIGALGRKICRPPFETKAWSLNMGHANDQITDRHYGKITEAQRATVMSQLSSPAHLAEAEKDLLIEYFTHRLSPHSAEFERARELARLIEDSGRMAYVE